MWKPDKYDKQHLRNLGLTEKQIEKIYDLAVKEAAAIGATIHDFNPDKPFSFDDYPRTKARIDRLIKELQKNVETAIVNGARSEWTLANNKNNALCDWVFGENKYKLTGEQERRYYSNNDKALEAFLKRKTNGLNLSDRVWNYTGQFKSEIEMGLDLGIRNGLSAAEMARELKQYLKYPDKLFRRVRDEHGQLHLSKAARAFHPGAGVYRSSFMNARRLAATETNMAYRTADHERWQQMDFVVGIEIRLSNNHTLNGKPFTDICDDLKGKYPKTFKFTGWHPLCRCHAVSILKTPEEFMREKEAIMEGKEPDAHSVNEVKDVPENFKKWVEDNKDRIAKAEKRGTLPYFIKDNRNTVDSAWRSAGIFNTAYGTTNIGRLKPTEILDLSNIDKTLRDKFKQDFTRGFTGIEAAPVGETYFMSTDINGKIFVNFASKDGFDSGTSLVNAFEKLKNGQSLTQDEEYSIEILWHEILHNKSKNTVILPPVNAVDTGFQRVAAETVNQLVARKTYPEFLKQLGGTAKHADWVLENGYGYKETVANMRKLLNTLDIDNRKFYIESEKLLMQDYTNFDKKIVNLMEDMSGRKNLMNVFGFIERDDFDNYLKILNKGR